MCLNKSQIKIWWILDFEVLLNGRTKIVGKIANGSATMSYRISGNIFIIGIQSPSDENVVDAVVIQVTGERSFDWLAAGRMSQWDGDFRKCDGDKDFIPDCFDTKSENVEDYNLELVAAKGTFLSLNVSAFKRNIIFNGKTHQLELKHSFYSSM